jgi:hypothetical protein
MLEVSLDQSSVYKTKPFSTSANSSQCVAVLKANTNTANSFLYCDSINCIPIVLDRPCNNQISVQILTSDLIPLVWTDCVDATLTGYVLILPFEKI